MLTVEIFVQEIMDYINLYFPKDDIFKDEIPNLSEKCLPNIIDACDFIASKDFDTKYFDAKMRTILLQYGRFYNTVESLYYFNQRNFDYKACIEELQLFLNKENVEDFIYYWRRNNCVYGFGNKFDIIDLINDDYGIIRIELGDRKFNFHFYNLRDLGLFDVALKEAANKIHLYPKTINLRLPKLTVSDDQYNEFISQCRKSKAGK